MRSGCKAIVQPRRAAYSRIAGSASREFARHRSRCGHTGRPATFSTVFVPGQKRYRILPSERTVWRHHLGPVQRPVEQRILPVQHRPLERAPAKIIVQWGPGFSEKRRHGRPVPQQIGDRLAQTGVGLCLPLGELRLQPTVQFLDHRLATLLMKPQPLLRCQATLARFRIVPEFSTRHRRRTVGCPGVRPESCSASSESASRRRRCRKPAPLCPAPRAGSLAPCIFSIRRRRLEVMVGGSGELRKPLLEGGSACPTLRPSRNQSGFL